MKHLYVIYDKKAQNHGEILTFIDDDEAIRAFIHSCLYTQFCDDLILLKVGLLYYQDDYIYSKGQEFRDILEIDDKKVKLPFFKFLDKCIVIREYCAVKDEVEKLKKDNLINTVLRDEVKKLFDIGDFRNDVSKICRYMSKKDKRFK